MQNPASMQLAENRARYDRLMRVVQSEAACHRNQLDDASLERVLISAAAAANHAWQHPVGIVNDPELERLVVDSANGGNPPALRRRNPTTRVLHVLTEAYSIGGHTRLATRWMERDHRDSDIVLTNQNPEVPERVVQAAVDKGGLVFNLRELNTSFVARARELRRLMERADIVVMHVHPFDTIALAAAAFPGTRPPVIFENHADHTYWLGLGCSDIVANHHAIGTRFSSTLRGVSPTRLGFLPLPIDAQQPLSPDGRTELRERLGLPPDTVLGYSVANAPKMAPVWGHGFSEILDEALAMHPQLTVLLAGPHNTGSWEELAHKYPGRLMALGPITDAATIFGAADIYLDSYPVTSSTSILEAALAGLPPLSLQLHTGFGELFLANEPGLDDSGHRTETLDEYRAELTRLVADRDYRSRRSAKARDGVAQIHTGKDWSESLERLYQLALTVPIADLSEYGEPLLEDGYAQMLVQFAQGKDRIGDVATSYASFLEVVDEQMRANFFIAAQDRAEGKLSVRIAPGWEAHSSWLSALLQLGLRYPRLALSLPFAAGDRGDGEFSVDRLSAVLGSMGLSVADCPDVSLEAARPTSRRIAVADELPPVPSAITFVEALLASSSWQDSELSPASVPGTTSYETHREQVIAI